MKPAFTSVDIYPMNVGYIMDSYFQDIDSFVTLCRERDIPYGIYIQSVSFASSKRKPNENDMRWQAYCCLAFGATDIEYFTYRTPDSSTEDFKDALIDRNNQKTESWYGAQKINAELNAFSSEFMTYRNLGAFSVNASSTYHMKFRNQYKDFDAIGKITVEDNAPILMGAFEKREGEGKAFVCVNGQDPGAFQNPITVTVELTEAKTAVIWQKGEKTTLTPDEKGCISFRLTAGEGVCVQLD
ncbi:MAG: beta-galactosidase [Clostridia bacterium]|nr:beta-galactosidase [Clostridia bacterium]